MPATMENLFLESPAHRAQLFDALDRATKQADEIRQGAPTAQPAFRPAPIVPEAVAPLWEPPSAFSNAIALVAAVALAGVAAFFSLGHRGH